MTGVTLHTNHARSDKPSHNITQTYVANRVVVFTLQLDKHPSL